jgi:uncharacterized protein (TIGR02186 family)
VTKKLLGLLIFGLACLAGLPNGAAAAADLQVAVQPNEILMGASYNGQNLDVSGTIPADATALIRVTGRVEQNKLKKKGRALGVLWMNQGAVQIANVPNVFLLYLPQGAQSALQMDSPAWLKLGLGLEAIRQQAVIESQDGNKEGLFEEFVKLKRKAGLYGTIPQAIACTNPSDGVKSFQCTLAMPSDLPPGKYKLEVFAIRNDAVEAYAVQEIEAKEVGMTAFIANLAFQHGTLYGVLAVLVAVIAGLLTGIMFKGGKGAH